MNYDSEECRVASFLVRVLLLVRIRYILGTRYIWIDIFNNCAIHGEIFCSESEIDEWRVAIYALNVAELETFIEKYMSHLSVAIYIAIKD